jgi:hypothetical protein
MTDIEIAERIYRKMCKHISSKETMAKVIEDLLAFPTKNQTYKNVVIAMAMIYANEEGH